MSSSITTSSVLPPAVREYYERMLLTTAFPYLIYTRFAQRRNLPKKSGDTVIFRRYAKLDTVPIAIVDGVTPPGAPLSALDIPAKVDFYGNFVTITNQVQLLVEDRVLNEAAELLAQNLGQTLDQVTRDVLASTGSSFQCSSGTNGGTPTEISDPDFTACVRGLLNNDARMLTKVMKATDQISTVAIRPAFFGFTSTNLIGDLEKIPSFVSTSNYPGDQSKTIMDAEWGQTKNIRWLVSSVASVSSATVPVYNNIIVGYEAYGLVNLGSEQGEFIVKPLGSAGAADPLNQRGSVGWSLPFVSRILNDNFMINCMSTVS